MRWGADDCCTRAAEHVRRLTGRDVFAAYAGRYATAREAARLIEAQGGLAAMIDAALDGVWTRGGHELALLGAEGREVLAVRDGAWWRMPGQGGDLLVNRRACAPLATWGPA